MSFFKKIKISDYIALLSLLIAGYALYQTSNNNSAIISVKDAPIFSFGMLKDGHDSYYHWLRLQFTNNGGKPVTLIKLEKPNDTPPFKAILIDGKVINADKELDLLYRDGSVIDKYDFLNAEDSARRIYPKDELILNKLINPGAVIFVDLCIKLHDGNQSTMETILLALDAEFSDSQKLSVRSSFDAKIKRSGR
jgi:hypothetical protein